ncbi:hypothetical protein PPL_09736 [Heterostelium album PN500]|uniref:Uncharacterized protein n=1 Tax=Heterostelium pallidum (strain ATCC 26659 / Pp 5 / PN500) TaxID=670386 RepID=D3BNN3_HETP5|nr:hypothetical protein PPL_09736 [Heterostelium album PN500]EFA76984.1 hypothetical protein PPL_09736 [Heterostelium album PN500]|eukprot:XP_020429115.1 hypothetical protein PPL_09736 [Heterostelium album PN500]
MATMFEDCFKMDKLHDFKLLTSLGVIATCISYYLRPKPYKIPDRLKSKTYRLSFVEHLLGATLILCIIANVGIRVAKGVPHWLCQPCHVLSFLLVYVIYYGDLDTRVFHYYFYSMWMPYNISRNLILMFINMLSVIGLLSPPNASWFTWWWEPHVFYIHHVLLLAIPYYYLMINHRFHPHLITKTSSHSDYKVDHITNQKSRFRFFNHIFGFGVIYHAFFLANLGLYLDEDFDSLRCRFSGGEIFGIYWREALISLCYVASILFAWIPDHFAHKHFIKKSLKSSTKQHSNNVSSENSINTTKNTNKSKIN